MNNLNKEQLVIWGAGRNGNLAYYYFKDNYSIVSYIDIDIKKHGTFLNGVCINKIEFLRKYDGMVAIAVQSDVEAIKKRLQRDYGINKIILFNITEDYIDTYSLSVPVEENSVIVFFHGGLGNQMFQYVLYRYYEKIGKNVYGNLSHYEKPHVMKFELTNIFKKIKIRNCDSYSMNDYIRRNTTDFVNQKNFTVYVESGKYSMGLKKKADMNLLNVSSGVIKGLFQTSVFAELIKNEILKDFSFFVEKEKKLYEIAKKIKDKNVTGIHFRRGDYLDDNNKWIYENICTDQYYRSAMEYMMEQNENTIFCFFSDDIEWVKKYYNMDGHIYIEETMFDDYQNWYDMYLMSLCKNNIIANSTFSWWGAWLNQDPDKIVVAPKKWINQWDYLDIYPEDWIIL
jgi:hypothetical protein